MDATIGIVTYAFFNFCITVINAVVPEHSRTMLFITHCGYNSMYEALQSGIYLGNYVMFSGTPILSVPLSLDQAGNAQRVRRLTNSTVLDLKLLTADLLVNASVRLLNSEQYRSL